MILCFQELLLTKPYFNFEVGHKLVIKEVYPHSSQYLCALDGGYDIYLLEDYLSIKTPHQARLDKVLSKFEYEEENNIKFIDLGNKSDVIYYDNEFSIGTYFHAEHEDRTIISLETVEHLIADLERGNE